MGEWMEGWMDGRIEHSIKRHDLTVSYQQRYSQRIFFYKNVPKVHFGRFTLAQNFINKMICSRSY